MVKEIQVECFDIPGVWGGMTSDQVTNLAKLIGATDLILGYHIPQMPQFLDRYIAAGFGVYLDIVPHAGGSPDFPTVSDIQPYLALPIRGLFIDYSFGPNDHPPADIESNLLALAAATQAAGKAIAYYHGDGALHIDAVKMGDAGIIVCDQWQPEFRYPYRWDPGEGSFETLPKVWAQKCIWLNRLEHGICTVNGTIDKNKKTKSLCEAAGGQWTFTNTPYKEIVDWIDTFPRAPEAIQYWLTTCHHNPSQEQIAGMRDADSHWLSL